MGTSFDVVIIGGGPAGSTAATLLAEAGWSVALIERAQFPRRKVCGEFLSATNLPLLQRLGVLEAFLERAGPEIKRVGLFARDVAVIARMPQPRKIGGGYGRALAREHLDGLLLERAAQVGAEVWQPWSAVNLREGAKGFICQVVSKNGGDVRELRARLVIAANGCWETGNLPWQIQRHRTRDSDLLGFKAHYAQAGLPSDLMPLLVFAGGYGGMVRTESGLVSLSCCVRRSYLERIRKQHPRESAGTAVFRHIRDSCGEARRSLAGATLHGAWMSVGPIRPAIRQRPRPGIFLVGNAAGDAHPLVAEGIGMAIQSAWLLCRRLIQECDTALSEAALERLSRDYEREWRSNFVPRIRAAACFAHLATSPAASEFSLLLLRLFPSLLGVGATWSGKARLVANACRVPEGQTDPTVLGS